VLTTHNKGVIDSLKKRVISMEDGKIIKDDPKGHYTL
jgi:ABC-type ATPase involved in cell division